MTAAEIHELPLLEKLRIMETIWLELREKVEGSEVPESHRRILDARRRRAETGESTIHRWDDVKDSIGRR